MSEVILENVTKNYGKVQGISNISVEIKPGLTGILGPNGAGKSTMMKMVLGLSRPSIGHVSVMGNDPFTNWKQRNKIGFVPEYDCFYEHMSGLDYVAYFLQMHNYTLQEANEMARVSLAELGLEDAMDRKIRTYSRGMRQKTKVARAAVFNPDIFVLDEPFQGADPTTRHLLMMKMKQWADEGKTIMISSHILHDIENLTDQIILINNGKMLASGNRHEIRNLMNNIPRQIHVTPIKNTNLRKLAKRMLDESWVRATRIDKENDELIIETDSAETFYLELPRIIKKEKIEIKRINSEDDSLDSLYTKLVGGAQWK
jgi:ABC-2 type transport system ATP-binding protein|tara:strand:+ start:1118 stop:2062 length:945 start_codon:yes stop_codon:yes gene_type:complete